MLQLPSSIRPCVFAWLFAVLAAPASTEDPTAFVDVTAAAGIDYLQHSPWSFGDCLVSPNFCQPDRQTGGAAVGDYDGDGWDDLFVTRLDDTDILFRNLGDGTFTDVTLNAGLLVDAPTNGPIWADFDRDGHLDLFVTVVGGTRNLLYMNNGDGTFTEQAVARGAAVENGARHIGFSAAVGDYDGDGYLDLFTTEWGSSAFLPNGAIGHSVLLRNRGAVSPGYFYIANDEAEILVGRDGDGGERDIFGFAPAFVDLDRDGYLDLAIASDFGTSQLLWNDGDGTFTDGTFAAQVGTDKNGMGSTFGDYDADGDLDWFVTAIWLDPEDFPDGVDLEDLGNRLYRNDANRVFSDVTDDAGVRNGMWGWGTVFFDYDNDTDLDLVMTNGVRFPGQEDDFEMFADDPLRLWNNDGTGQMTEVSEAQGIVDLDDGKGLLTFDYDRDGDLDVLCINNGDGPTLYRNDTGNANDWLRIRFKDADTGFEGLNAFITLTLQDGAPAQVREHGVSSHFLGQSERVSHFGLGPHAETPVHELRIEWPRSGTVQIFSEVARNQELTIDIPEAERVYPRDFTCHALDYQNCDFVISLSELLRLIQHFNSDGYHADDAGEDGFAPGPGSTNAYPHHSDYAPENWRIELGELLRAIQFYNSGGFTRDPAGEDGFAPLAAG